MDKRCMRGHSFDPAKFSSCPHCGVPGLNAGPTMPHRQPSRQNEYLAGSEGNAEASPQAGLGGHNDDERTRQVLDAKLGMHPVVGWLVSISGPLRGRDFRIFGERNLIGRASTMDISIPGDDSISRERHAVVSYDPKKNSFSLSQGESAGPVYVNNEEVERSVQLKPYDRIQIGRTELLFVPFCGEHFQWLEPGKVLERAN
jgi:hypothetical protein